jgi:hypothetical protein
MDKYIVVVGDPVDGFEFYGPFNTEPEAIEWAGENLNGDWWTASLSAEV